MFKEMRIILILLLMAMIVFGILDLYDDSLHGLDLSHMLFESSFILVCLWAIVVLFRGVTRQKNQFEELVRSESGIRKAFEEWKTKTRSLRENLRKNFEQQFDEWNFSKAEREVAFLILRGYSFDQVSSLLSKSERTVRKQAGSLYEKSGFHNRAEFVGFFLESIFELEDEESLYD